MKHLVLICNKLKEADFFLEKMASSDRHVDELNYYFSAFASAARSVTFVLQYVGSAIKGFDEWYSNVQHRLKDDKVAKYLLEARNESQKRGVQPIAYSKVVELPSGEKNILHFFSYIGSNPPTEVPSLDAYSICHYQMKILASIVSEFLTKFENTVWDPSEERTNILEYMKQAKSLMFEGNFPESLWDKSAAFITSADFKPLRPSELVSSLLEKYST